DDDDADQGRPAAAQHRHGLRPCRRDRPADAGLAPGPAVRHRAGLRRPVHRGGAGRPGRADLGRAARGRPAARRPAGDHQGQPLRRRAAGRGGGPDRRAAGHDLQHDRPGPAGHDDAAAGPDPGGGQPGRAAGDGEGRRHAGRPGRAGAGGRQGRGDLRRGPPDGGLAARRAGAGGHPGGRRPADDLHPHLRHHRRPQVRRALGDHPARRADQAGDHAHPGPGHRQVGHGRVLHLLRARPGRDLDLRPAGPAAGPGADPGRLRAGHGGRGAGRPPAVDPGGLPEHLPALGGPGPQPAAAVRQRPGVHQHLRRGPPAHRPHLPGRVPAPDAGVGAGLGADRGRPGLHGRLHPRPAVPDRRHRPLGDQHGRPVDPVRHRGQGGRRADPAAGAARHRGHRAGADGRALPDLPGRGRAARREDVGRLVEHRRHRRTVPGRPAADRRPRGRRHPRGQRHRAGERAAGAAAGDHRGDRARRARPPAGAGGQHRRRHPGRRPLGAGHRRPAGAGRARADRLGRLPPHRDLEGAAGRAAGAAVRHHRDLRDGPLDL
ncbi:MAG: CoA ligase, partial [uncultured Corynebacteriales bacterium]